MDTLHSGKLLEAANALEEGKNAIAIRMKHIVLADLHGWDFVTEYKQIPVAKDETDEKQIRKILEEVGNQREKKKAERAKKANKLRPDFRRVPTRFTNESSAFTPLSTCFLCNRPGHFWRNCWRSKYPTASASNNAFSWQPNLLQLGKELLSEISGSDDIFGIQEEPGDTNFLLELRGLKNAEVTESSPVQSVQG